MSGRTRRDERGTIGVLLLGLSVIAMTLVAGAVAVTSAQLSRMALLDVADGAALAAANALDEGAYAEGVGEAVPLSDVSVRDEAVRYLASTERPARVTGWRLGAGTGTPDGETAVVVLVGDAELPMVGGMLSDLGVAITITVTSSARADVVQP
ncbi:hypothetical protein KC207_11255 [Phycicoccus sp. BSK3Z-2]|uniref:Uncharacterized protein n=1 Tax=Phycicoccus avicenniae TaxID=2828860 RepID=A0A941DBC1_9MICO|nr:pilus assembly protein TadG-related protein [Phycicoccus avicenniae]MBR7743867.1 hypothetical protein [Phycicoccus avicenniae]